MPHRLTFEETKFSCILKKKAEKKNTEAQDNCNILLPVCFKHPILRII